MAYIRTKKIKGHTYYYLVEGKREGGKVRQKVLGYLGAAAPSPGFSAGLKNRSRKSGQGSAQQKPDTSTDMTAEERDEQRQIATADAATRAVAYLSFEQLGFEVRHNIKDSEDVQGLINFRRNFVQLKKDPTASVVTHELGHAIDTLLSDRAGPEFHGWFGRRFDFLDEDDEERYDAILKDCASVGHRFYTEDFLALSVLGFAVKKGTATRAQKREYKDRQAFFTEYVESRREGFANAFSLMCTDYAEARRLAPTLTEEIETRMNEHDDLRELLDLMRKARSGAPPTDAELHPDRTYGKHLATVRHNI